MKASRLMMAAVLLVSSSVFAEDTSFEIRIKDHQFNPATLEVPAGKKIKLVVINEDASAEEFESHDLNREKVIKGNSQAVIFVGPLKAGSYKYEGEFNPKTAQGVIEAK